MTSGPDVIGVGPDTGHLRWAGIDPAPFIRRYADRMGGIHIKDCFPDYLSPPRAAAGMSYPSCRPPSGCGPSRAAGWWTSTPCVAALPRATTATS